MRIFPSKHIPVRPLNRQSTAQFGDEHNHGPQKKLLAAQCSGGARMAVARYRHRRGGHTAQGYPYAQRIRQDRADVGLDLRNQLAQPLAGSELDTNAGAVERPTKRRKKQWKSSAMVRSLPLKVLRIGLLGRSVSTRYFRHHPALVAGASVTFEPGARTAWHTHPLGQTLIVTAGCGRVS